MFGDAPKLRMKGDEPLDPAATTDEELTERVLELERLRTRLDAEEALLLGELDARGSTDRIDGLRTGPWLAHHAGRPAGVAKNQVRVARRLRAHFPVVAEALAAGRIGWEHARVISDVANRRILDIVIANQHLLLGLADRCRFEAWNAEVRSLARMWDQDGGYDPNEDPDANRLSYGATLDGLVTLAATLTGENAEVVTQAIEAKTDELHLRAVRDHEACPELEVPSRVTLRALALTELIRQALGVDVDSTAGPKVDVTIIVDADDPTSATNPDGVRLADGSTRVLLCDPVLHPLVVDSLSVPLDAGNGVEFANRAQRRAARRRDGGCTFPGCGAKVLWCDVHHCVHRHHGGVTDLCNLICLCRHHHGVVHRKGWSVRLDADGWTIYQTPTGKVFWGQRHGRQRAGPPPDPLHDRTQLGEHSHRRPIGGFEVVTGRHHRIEDPYVVAAAQQDAQRRHADLRTHPRAS